MGNGKKPYNYNGNRKHNKNVKNNRKNNNRNKRPVNLENTTSELQEIINDSLSQGRGL